MKYNTIRKVAFTLLVVNLFTIPLFAQLGNITIISAPCESAPGFTGTITASAVPGATYYVWSLDSGSSNSMLFNSNPGPLQTSIPNINFSCQLAMQVYTVCVTAYNATDSSNTACTIIWGYPHPPVFSAANSYFITPGSWGLYSVDSSLFCPAYEYIWTLYGDATFNNNGQSTTTQSYLTPVNIHFASTFSSGTLCVQAVSSWGMTSDSVCMIITTTLGTGSLDNSGWNCYYQPLQNQIIIEFSEINSSLVYATIYDITGRQIAEKTISENTKFFSVSTSDYSPGIYLLELNGNSFRKAIKFVIPE